MAKRQNESVNAPTPPTMMPKVCMQKPPHAKVPTTKGSGSSKVLKLHAVILKRTRMTQVAMTTVIATTQIEIEALLPDATACCWYLAANESERGSGYNREEANRLEPHMKIV